MPVKPPLRRLISDWKSLLLQASQKSRYWRIGSQIDVKCLTIADNPITTKVN